MYWWLIAYVVGSAVGFYLGRKNGLLRGITDTLYTLEAEHYIRTKTDRNGSVDLIKLPPKYRTFKRR